MGHDAEISAFSVSSNGLLCATGQVGSSSSPNRLAPILIWDLTHRKLVRELHGLAGRVLSLDISSDNKFIVALGLNDLLIVFDIEIGETVASKRIAVSDSIKCVFARPISEIYKFAVITESSVLSFSLSFETRSLSFTLSSPQVVKSPTGLIRHPNRVLALSDGAVLIVNQSGDISHYNLLTNQFIGVISQVSSVVDIDRFPDDSILVLCHTPRLIRINLADKSFTNIVFPQDEIITAIQTCSNDSFLFQAQDGRICLSTSATPILTMPTCRPTGVQFLTRENESPCLVVTTTDSIELWSIGKTRFSRFSKIMLPKKFGECLSLSCRDDFVACGFESGSVQIFQNRKFLSTIDSHRGPVSALALGPNFLVSGGQDDSTVRIWTLSKTPQLVCQVTQSIGAITFVSICESQIFYCNNKREIFGFELKSEKIIAKFSCVKFGDITGLEKSRIQNGEYIDTVLVSSHKCGKLCVWDADYPDHPIHRFQWERNIDCVGVQDVETDPKILIGSRDGLVALLQLSAKFGIQKISEKNHPIISASKTKLCEIRIVKMGDDMFAITRDDLGTISLFPL